MKTLIPIEDFLSLVREFKSKYPGSHVGGSLGLFLHGIDLQRTFLNSDLDITLKTPMPEKFEIDHSTESSNPEDFEVQLRVHPNSGTVYIKVDINVKPDSRYNIINYQGHSYNVSLKEDILFWKKKYAEKGIQKHIDDLITIETGVRPPEKVYQPADDDLPF